MALGEICMFKLMFFGQVRENRHVLELQMKITDRLLEPADAKLHVVTDLFSFEMQHLLDDFQEGRLTLKQLRKEYENIGTENHNLKKYKSVLMHALKHKKRIKLHAGVMPWPFACISSCQNGVETAVKMAKARGYIGSHVKHKDMLNTTSEHYNYFESLITGRNLHKKGSLPDPAYVKRFA